jgi:hypothetical protein
MKVFDIQPYPALAEADRSLTNFYDDLIDDRVCGSNGNTVATSVACMAIKGNITHALRQYFTSSLIVQGLFSLRDILRHRSALISLNVLSFPC